MKHIIINEAQFISLLGNNNKTTNDNDIFYQDGDFIVTNDKINKYREIFNPSYDKEYNGDINIILHKMAFKKTMEMIDNNQTLPEFNDPKIYHSLTNKTFSKQQVNYVEQNYIIPKYKHMTIEQLYDELHIDMERNQYNTTKQCKQAVAKLINNGTFKKLGDRFLQLALWDIGKLQDTTEFFGWLYSINPFTHKTNSKTLSQQMHKMMDIIADNNDAFMTDDMFLALNELIRALSKLNRKG